MILVKIEYLEGTKRASIYDGIFSSFSVVMGFKSIDEAMQFINDTNKKA